MSEELALPSLKTEERPFNAVKSADFNAEDLSDYHLFLQFSRQSLRVLVTDQKIKNCLAAEEYYFPCCQASEKQLRELHAVYNNHPFLKAGFWKSVSILYKSENHTLIPKKFFEESLMQNYLQQSTFFNLEELSAMYTVHKGAGIVNVFSLPKDLLTWLKSMYKHTDLSFFHHTDALLRTTLRNSGKDRNCIFSDFSDGEVTLTAASGGVLKYCQVFQAGGPNDVLYRIAVLNDQLNASMEETPVFVSGLVKQQAPLLKEYIREVIIAPTPDLMAKSTLLDELPESGMFALACCSLLQ